MTLRVFSLLLLLGFVIHPGPSVRAQSSTSQFKLGSAATIIDDECIRLTPDVPYVNGSAWYEEPINLAGPFEMTICLVLGEKDREGADGIAFVFSPNLATGFRGEGMGFSGLRPSLGIEFDTYQNYHLGDPVEDHLAINPNGTAWHGATLVGPIPLVNLEDGNKHLLRITWDPALPELRVYVDKQLQVTYQQDIVSEIFGGNSVVYWGATAATGRLSNYQDICIKKLVFAGVE